MKKKGILYNMVMMAMGALWLAGCHETIHEHPAEVVTGTGLYELVVELNADLTPPTPYVDIVYSSRGTIERKYHPAGESSSTRIIDFFDEEEYILRFIVELYKGTSQEVESGTATLLKRDVVFAEITDDLSQYTLTYEVEAGTYTVVAWSDYVKRSATIDLYYDCSTLYSVLYSDTDITDNDSKDAYTGVQQISVSASQPQTHVVVTLIRPFGRYQIIGTDFDFLRHVGKDLTDLQIEVRYKQFVSSGYNVFQQVPNKFVESRTFNNIPRSVTEDGIELALLAYDYIFVNGTESNVLIDLFIYDLNHQLLARSTEITIPIVRNKETTVRGEFITTNFGNDGLGIDERFEGEIIIPIN